MRASAVALAIALVLGLFAVGPGGLLAPRPAVAAATAAASATRGAQAGKAASANGVQGGSPADTTQGGSSAEGTHRADAGSPADSVGATRGGGDFLWRAGFIESDLIVHSDSLRLHLPAGWIEAASFRLSRGDTLLTRGVDFLLDPRRGLLRLLRSIPDGTKLHALYRSFPVPIGLEYQRHPLRATGTSGSAPADSGAAAVPESRPATGGVDAAHLQISGTKTFSVEVGTAQDLALKQSLDLSVNGQITRDVSVKAILTDRQTPLQPDGTSTQLDNLDRVLVQVEGPSASMTLGDYHLVLPQSEFANLDRQLEGVRAEAEPGKTGFLAAAATSPGTYLSQEIIGEEGKQGPYQLGTGVSYSSGVIVAGSERITLDGVALTRGESEDYIMDYSQATLTFTSRHPITAYSKISVEYQLSEDSYPRRLYVVGGSWGAFSGGPWSPGAGPPGTSGAAGIPGLPVSSSVSAGSGGSGSASGVLNPSGIAGAAEAGGGPGGRGGSGNPAGDTGLVSAGADPLHLRALYISESDDRSNPVVPLTDAQKAALRAAGDSLTPALRSDVVLVGAGHGDYNQVRVDTLASPFFRYAGADSGSWQVSFENVGDGQGDYAIDVHHISATIYTYVGHLKGGYLPGGQVPRPQSTSLFSLSMAPQIGHSVVGAGRAGRLEIRRQHLLSDRRRP